MTCVSGSPSRALHSSRTRAVVGEHQAGVQEAAERRAAAGQLGQDRPVERSTRIASTAVVGQVGQRAEGAHPAGVRARVAVARAACGRGRRQRERPRPSHSAITLASRPSSRSSTTTAVRHRRAARPRSSAAIASRRGVSQTVTPLPAASPSALTTTPAPPPPASAAKADRLGRVVRTRRRGPSGRRPPPRPRGRTPCRSRSGRPPRVGPKTAMPASIERVGHAGRQRRLGPDRRRARPRAPARDRDDRRASSGSTSGHAPDPRLARRSPRCPARR